MFINISGTPIKLIAKCGSQSLVEAGDDWYLNDYQAEIYKHRIAFIREPLERLGSCYSFFKLIFSDGVNYDGDINPHNARSWHSFVDFVLDSNSNDEHIKPQSEQVSNVTHIFRFDEMNNWWPKISPKKLQKLNESVRQPIDDYRISELRAKYIDDLELYNSAIRYTEGAPWPLA